MSKKLLPLIVINILMSFLSAKAQKRDTITFYMRHHWYDSLDFSNVPVKSKDSAEFYRTILPPDTNVDKTLFIVNDYYKNGKLLMEGKSSSKESYLHAEGPFIVYYPNGRQRSVKNYKDNRPMGDNIEYYPNGKLYMSGVYNKDHSLIINEYRDSTGKVLVQNGNGQCKQYDWNFKRVIGEGLLKNGLKEGEWRGLYRENLSYICYYENGVLIKGASYDDKGGEHPFTKEQVEPTYKGGIDAFYKFLASNVRYPKEAKKHNIQGKVILSFVVNKDGTLSDIKVIKGIGGGCDEESVRVLQQSPLWEPGYQFGLPVRVQYRMPLNFSLLRANE